MTQANTIYNRHDPAKRYERHLFRADRVLQSAELNEVQSAHAARVQRLGDVLFKEGGIVRQAGIVVDHDTGATTCESGAVYIAGDVRGVPTGQLQIPVLGIVTVGVYLTRHTVTELEDPTLRNPAVGVRGYDEPGAARERIDIAWGYRGDGQDGDFFPIWTVEDGWVRPKEPPPNIDAVTQALARYDRESAGGTYITRGFELTQGADLPTGEQTYTLAEGLAHVNGHAIELATTRRLVYATAPDLLLIDAEPHQSATEAAQRIETARWPIVGAPQVRIVARKTVTVVHGGHTGAADPLPDTAVVAIELVKQGGTTFNSPADYKLTANQVDWSAGGAEPTPGSSYEVTYRHVRLAEVTDVDQRGFTVEGALPATTIDVTYHQALRRIDRLTISADGVIAWVKGVSAEWQPVAPTPPAGTLALASVFQTWDATRRVVPDGVRMVPMDEMNALREMVARVKVDTAELRLAVDIAGRYTGIKKGTFADPFQNNAMRDAGVPQTAAIVAGALRLPMAIKVHQLGLAINSRQTPAFNHVPGLSQTMRTGSMLVNPYQAYDALPRAVTLTPAVDRWTDTQTQWVNPITEWVWGGDTSTIERELSSTTTALQFLRQIDVQFALDFGPGEQLQSVTFGGIALTAQPLPGGSLVANAQGVLAGKFTVPANVPAGSHAVVFRGSGGSVAETVFTGQGTLVQREAQQVTRVIQSQDAGGNTSGIPSWWSEWVFVDPLAQTFTMRSNCQATGIRLWFTARGTSDALVQLREADAGYPTRRVLSETRVKPAAMQLGGAPTLVTWDAVVLQAGREYCVVVMSDDAVTALSIAELGKFDEVSHRWVTSQPYQVGVLLSSSNASTWTPHQDRDLSFELMVAQYTQTERLLDLGTVAVADATDLAVQAFVHQPSVAAVGTFLLTMPGRPTIEVAAGQVAMLPQRYTGNVQVSARLRGDANMAAVLEPGMQLIEASIQNEGDYITPWLTAGGAVRVRVVIDADLPAGSAVHVHAMSDAPGAAWVPVPFASSSAPTAGIFELTYELAEITGGKVRLRITPSGSHTARPALMNLRAVTL